MNIFDVINLIETTKPTWEELPEDAKKAYNPFMVNRLVSSKKQYVQIIAELAKTKLTPEQHYTFINSLIPARKHYFNYKAYKNTKKDDDELLFALRTEYQIGNKDALLYLSFMSELEQKELKKKWAAYYKEYGKQ